MPVQAATASEQWDSFTAHHVGEWFGAKTVYDAAGAVVDEDSVAITCLRRDNDEVTHVLKVPAAALAASGCDRCADTIEWRDIPAGSYKEGALGRFTVNGRGAAVALIAVHGVLLELMPLPGARSTRALTLLVAPDAAEGRQHAHISPRGGAHRTTRWKRSSGLGQSARCTLCCTS